MLAKVQAAAKKAVDWALHVQPVAVAHAASAVVAVVAAARSGHLDLGLVAAAWLAVQGVFLWNSVSPAA